MVTQYHYNPESYLYGFAKEDGGLFRYSKSRNIFQPNDGGNYTNYGSKRNLYSELFEKSYTSKLDYNFTVCRKNIEKFVISGDKNILTQSDFNSLVEFISTQPFRTYESFKVFHSANLMFPNKLIPTTKEMIRNNFGELIKQNAKIVTSKISNSRLILYIASEGIPFMTSDNVTSIYRNKAKTFLGYNDMYLDPDSNLFFPITSRICLWIGDTNTDSEFVEIRKEMLEPKRVSAVNTIIYKQATEYVYASRKEIIEEAIHSK